MVKISEWSFNETEIEAFRSLNELKNKQIVFDNHDDPIMGCPIELIVIEEIVIWTDIFEEFDEVKGGELSLFLANNYIDVSEFCPFTIPQTDHFVRTGSDIFTDHLLIFYLIFNQVKLISNRIQ